jgi:hypothetical protein
MTRFLAACAALVAATLPVSAQTIDPGSAGRVTVPSAQNSGPGIPGMRDTESGPAPKSTDTESNARKENNEAVREQDAAKIPGLPGNKSGPAVHPGSSSVSAQSAGNGLQSIQQKVRHNLQQGRFYRHPDNAELLSSASEGQGRKSRNDGHQPGLCDGSDGSWRRVRDCFQSQ